MPHHDESTASSVKPVPEVAGYHTQPASSGMPHHDEKHDESHASAGQSDDSSHHHDTHGGAAHEEHTLAFSDVVVDRLARIARFDNAPERFVWMSKSTSPRLFLLRLVLDPWFDNLVILAIVINTAFLCAYDPFDRDDLTYRNQVVRNSELAFTVIFSAEMLLKIFAFGAVGRGSYFWDSWNWVDALVVAIGWVSYATPVGNVSSLRVLRLIKACTQLSGLRVIVNALINALPNTFATLLFGVMYMLLWALLGLEMWLGIIGGTCTYEKAGSTVFLPEVRCALPSSQFEGVTIPQSFGAVCPSVISEGGYVDSICLRSNPDYGQTSFDNVGSALLTSFIDIVAEGWVDTMYQLWQTWGQNWLVSILFVFHRFFGVWAIFQVTVAVVVTEYNLSFDQYVRYKKNVASIVESLRETASAVIAARSGTTAPHVAVPVPALRDGTEEHTGAMRMSQGEPPGHGVSATGDVVPASGHTDKAHGHESYADPATSRASDHQGGHDSHGHHDGQAAATALRATLLAELRSVYTATLVIQPVLLSPAHSENDLLTRSKTATISWLAWVYSFVPGVPSDLQMAMRVIVTHKVFDAVMIAIIVANAVVLSMPYEGMSDSYSSNLDYADWTFVCIFALEMLLRMIALGFRGYWLNGAFAFDGAVTIISLADMALAIQGTRSRGFSVIRLFRLFRALQPIPGMRNVIIVIVNAIPATAYALLLFMLFMLLFALLGLHLFGGRYADAISAGAITATPIYNFNDLWMSFVTVFQLVVTEDFKSTILLHMTAFGDASVIYFVLAVVLGWVGMTCFIGGASRHAGACSWSSSCYMQALRVLGHFSRRLRSSARTWLASCVDPVVHFPRIMKCCVKETVGAPPGGPPPPPPPNLLSADLQHGHGHEHGHDSEHNSSQEHSDKDEHNADHEPHNLGLQQGTGDKHGGNHEAARGTSISPPDSSIAPSVESPVSPSGIAVPASKPISELHRHGVLPPLEHNPRPSLVENEATSPAPLLSPPATPTADEPQIIFETSRHGRLKKVEANIGSSAGKNTMKIVIDGAQLHVEHKGHEDLDDDEEEERTLYGDEGAPPPQATCSGYLFFFPKGEIYGHLESEAKRLTAARLERDSTYLTFFFLWLTRVRMLAAAIVSCRVVDWFILFVILISSVNLALEEPRIDQCKHLPSSDSGNCIALAAYLYYADIIITAIFAAEAALHLAARGVAFTPFAYFHSGWRWLDALVVAVSIAALAAGDSAVQSLRALRALRALRVLRGLARFPHLKLVVDAMLHAIPKAKYVGTMFILGIYLFAVLGLQSFRGTLSACNDTSISLKADCFGDFKITEESCGYLPTSDAQEACELAGDAGASFPRMWEAAPENFDNIGNALLTVWEIMTGVNWSIVTAFGMNSAGYQVSRSHASSPSFALYYMFGFFLLHWVLFDLFVALLIEVYMELRDTRSKHAFLSPGQRVWVQNMRLLLTASLPLPEFPPLTKVAWINSTRAFLFKVATSTAFNVGILLAIVANIAFMCSRRYGESQQSVDAQNVAGAVFTAIFAAEALLKIVAMGYSLYFASWFNRFDFALAVGSVIAEGINIPSVGIVMRIFRIFRLFRITRYSKRMSRVLYTLVLSLPGFTNVFIVVLFDVFVFTVIGMDTFSYIKSVPGSTSIDTFSTNYPGSYVNSNANFNSFGLSLMTMLRSITGEQFNGILHSLVLDAPYCDPNAKAGDPSCGVPLGTTAIFWVIFYTIGALIHLHFLTALLLEGYRNSTQDTSSESGAFALTHDELQNFIDLWVAEDRQSTQRLPFDQAATVVSRLFEPLGLRRHDRSSPHADANSPFAPIDEARAFLRSLKMPVVVNKAAQRSDAEGTAGPADPDVYFHTLLDALVDRASLIPPLGSRGHAAVGTRHNIDLRGAGALRIDDIAAAASHVRDHLAAAQPTHRPSSTPLPGAAPAPASSPLEGSTALPRPLAPTSPHPAPAAHGPPAPSVRTHRGAAGAEPDQSPHTTVSASTPAFETAPSAPTGPPSGRSRRPSAQLRERDGSGALLMDDDGIQAASPTGKAPPPHPGAVFTPEEEDAARRP